MPVNSMTHSRLRPDAWLQCCDVLRNGIAADVRRRVDKGDEGEMTKGGFAMSVRTLLVYRLKKLPRLRSMFSIPLSRAVHRGKVERAGTNVRRHDASRRGGERALTSLNRHPFP